MGQVMSRPPLLLASALAVAAGIWILVGQLPTAAPEPPATADDPATATPTQYHVPLSTESEAIQASLDLFPG